VTEITNSSWDTPVIEPWRGKYSVIVEEENEGKNNSPREHITKRFILDTTGDIKLVESHSKQHVQALIQITSQQVADNKEVGELRFDIDGNGSKEYLRCGFWSRWGVINDCILYQANGSIIQKMSNDELQCKRIGFLSHKTSGVHDLVCDFDTVLVWKGDKYTLK
jgi:hypothetical protein